MTEKKSPPKTLKREVATALLAGLGYVVYTGDVEMVKVLVWPVFSFAGLAFGMDWYGKASNSNPTVSFTSRR